MSDWRVPLWEEINRYVVACGGDPGKHVYGNVTRMNAVVAVESVVKKAIDPAYGEMPVKMFRMPRPVHCLRRDRCDFYGCNCDCGPCVAVRSVPQFEI